MLAEVHNLFQRLVEALASDVKYRPGERHRCGLWIESGGELILLHASAGFPDHYLRNRRLDIERSIAGKSFRRGQTIVLDNVRENDDWEPNPESSSPYLALICIPIGRWGVLTVDALHPMKEHVKMICELYGCMIEGAMEEYMRLLSVTEIAASKPEKKQA
ncbi:GAF domain-containing protein [Brevibacillus massiliensis]|uniref:GAF domain-containing protein n=1 Tax=Brevibacillus massiliensis TaxID=1118054 RepID=UPI00315C7FB1